MAAFPIPNVTLRPDIPEPTDCLGLLASGSVRQRRPYASASATEMRCTMLCRLASASQRCRRMACNTS